MKSIGQRASERNRKAGIGIGSNRDEARAVLEIQPAMLLACIETWVRYTIRWIGSLIEGEEPGALWTSAGNQMPSESQWGKKRLSAILPGRPSSIDAYLTRAYFICRCVYVYI